MAGLVTHAYVFQKKSGEDRILGTLIPDLFFLSGNISYRKAHNIKTAHGFSKYLEDIVPDHSVIGKGMVHHLLLDNYLDNESDISNYRKELLKIIEKEAWIVRRLKGCFGGVFDESECIADMFLDTALDTVLLDYNPSLVDKIQESVCEENLEEVMGHLINYYKKKVPKKKARQFVERSAFLTEMDFNAVKSIESMYNEICKYLSNQGSFKVNLLVKSIGVIFKIKKDAIDFVAQEALNYLYEKDNGTIRFEKIMMELENV